MRAVLADAGPLYAAADADDAHHPRAQRELNLLAEQKREVIVAYPTLCESYSLILHRLGINSAKDWLEDVLMGVSLINPTGEDYRAARLKLRSLADQPVTFFDATVAVLSARLHLEVWTYDHHFDLMRAAVWRG